MARRTPTDGSLYDRDRPLLWRSDPRVQSVGCVALPPRGLHAPPSSPPLPDRVDPLAPFAHSQLVEILTFNKMLESDRRAGDLDFDPLKLDSPAMRLREVKHGRLAMLSIRTF